MSGLKVTRKENETWRQTVERYASEVGLEEECLAAFNKYREVLSEDEAAWSALYDWDLLDFDS